MEVSSLLSSTKCHSLNFTQLPPGHRTCSFISHLNSPGSMQPGCHFWRTEVFKHPSVHYPTRYPRTPGSRQCMCRQSALPRCITSQHNSGSRGLNPWSLACKSHTLPPSHNASPQNPMSIFSIHVYVPDCVFWPARYTTHHTSEVELICGFYVVV